MSTPEPAPNTTEPEVLEAGITKKTESQSDIVESRLPEAPNTTKMIEDLLDEKKAMGLNLSNKETYVRIFNEIAQTVGCSYNNVKKVAKKHLNASNQVIKETVVSDKNKINIKGITDDIRPPPKNPPPEQPRKSVPMLSPSQTQEINDAQIKFETEMILMSFENISGFQQMFLGFSPKSAKMKKMAISIATFNQMMRNNGRPEDVISVGETIMKYMLYAGIAGMFLSPLAEKFIGKQNDNGIKKKASMR